MRAVAVCCGFNDYGSAELRRSTNDAALLYGKLTESKAFNSDPALIGAGRIITERTTANKVLAAFKRAASTAAELVWFSFSGHAKVSSAGELRLLLPSWREDSSEVEQKRFSIGSDDLLHVMRAHSGNKKFILVLDTCHGGAFGSGSMTRDIAMAEQRASASGVVVIASCTQYQLALDCDKDSFGLNGVFTTAVIKILQDRARTGKPLSVFDLFLETKREVTNGQRPTLYASGLTDDFLILSGTSGIELENDGRIARMTVLIPANLINENSKFLDSVVRISKKKRLGLVHAEQSLEKLAGEFCKYNGDTYVVSGHNTNVMEAFDNARISIIGCTTPAYVDEWRRGGVGMRKANELFVTNGGRVTRFFFVRNGFEDRDPAVLNVMREHVKSKICIILVNIDLFLPHVVRGVFKSSNPSDLSLLECAFVDREVFLRTRFAANGDMDIEIAQRSSRCQDEYKAKLRPFLDAQSGLLQRAVLKPGNEDEILLFPLASEQVASLRTQLETDLGMSSTGLLSKIGC